MEKELVLLPTKFQLQIVQAKRKISWLEALYLQTKNQEKVYFHEVLGSHKRSARLEQDLLLAKKRNDKLLVSVQEAKKQNKAIKTDYLEACKKNCVLKARISCMANREKLLEERFETVSRSLKRVEEEHSSTLDKIAQFQHAKELLENRKRDAFEELYELQAKNAELEINLQFMKRRIYFYTGKESETRDEELMECDRELAHSTENQLAALKRRERDEVLESLHDTERKALESERRNANLQEQIADLTITITDKDQQIRKCKQLFGITRRNYQEEICKLEGSIFKWQSKYKQCLIDLEKESIVKEKKEVKESEQRDKSCWKCDLQLRACESDISERDIKIAYLQKINNTHEDKIRQILNQYKKSEDIFNDDLYDGTVTDLHNQLQLLLAFYKKRTENVSTELKKWKELAIEARLCREKETLLFESQLALISKEYYAKYENYRGSFEREKTQRLALESQTKTLMVELDECQKQFHSCRKQLNHLRQRHESLTSNNNNIKITLPVTQQRSYNTTDLEQEFVFIEMADDENVFLEPQTAKKDEDVDEQSQLKPENIECERDGLNIVEIAGPIDDSQDGTTASKDEPKPVVLSSEMESTKNATVNDSSVSNGREVLNDQSMSIELQSLRAKNNELQVLCETLMRGNDKPSAGSDCGQQCFESAVKCETHQTLKQQLDESISKCTTLEKSNSVLKAENERLENVVKKLQERIVVLESQNKLVDSKTNMANEVNSSAEVDGATNDPSAKDIEDALNESFAAQDITDSTPKPQPTSEESGEATIKEESARTVEETMAKEPVITPGDALNEPSAMQDITDTTPKPQPTSEGGNEATIKDEPARTVEETIQEEPARKAQETIQKEPANTPARSPHSSLARNKLPSAATTAPIPFGKRHSHAGITSTQRSRPRTGSAEFGTASDRRASVGSDTSDAHADDENKPKPPPVKKYSTSHLDAFKPKPFMKKQTSLSDELHMFSRQRFNSKTGSTGSASDTESAPEAQQDDTEAAVNTPFENQTQPESQPKAEPPATLPKPHKTDTESPAKHDFPSGFSYKEYMSGVHPNTESNENAEKPTEDTGELV